MGDIKNVTLQFNCLEKPDDKLYCAKCAHTITDFTTKTNDELAEAIKKANKPVCGFFKRSQLSDQFLKYAAATFIASSLTNAATGQITIHSDSLLNSINAIEFEKEESVFLGFVIQTQAEPVNGYPKFFEEIQNSLQYPPGLNQKGKSFVGFTIDSTGTMRDVHLVKGFNDLADKEAVRVLATLNYPFHPAKEEDKPVQTKLVIPVTFDPEKKKNVSKTKRKS